MFAWREARVGPVFHSGVVGEEVPGSVQGFLGAAQMPAGIPVATVAIGGGRNAGLLAIQILAISDVNLRGQVIKFRAALAAESRAKNASLAAEI
jgi:5-(carboxyamino)imidazole ribonucleotide mutase